MKKKILKIYVIFGFVLLFLIGFYWILPSKEELSKINQYHHSQFFKYSKFIDQLIKESGVSKIDLKKTLGGIVPHHIPTGAPLLAKFYKSLKNTREIKTFVILGPDHLNKGKGEINVSKANFVMPFGTLLPNLEIIEKLEKSGFIFHDEVPFEGEISIDSQLLFISKLFPEAQVVPLVFNPNISNKEAEIFGKALANFADKDTFVIASIDFSHYLSEKQARLIDSLSARVLNTIDPKLISLVNSDSNQALRAFISFIKSKKATNYKDLEVFNTSDLTSSKDQTTGYIIGFFGIK